ncbi:MAG: RraA family protein [Bacteroidales bacterium]|jgi:regulator of RNase E activity RraA|nr:RraA family protein [Bacteroidales bacterium]
MNTKDLCSGIFSDIMDSLGYKDQIITNYRNNWVSPVSLMGRARTLLIETYETDDENISMGLGFLSCIGKGEILIVKGSYKFAYFGELMTRLCIRQGLEGVIIDGLTRDTTFTHSNCPLPIISIGYSPVDIKGRGRVQAVDVDITISDVAIHKDDLIFADNDAICVIPQEIEKQVLSLAEASIEEERKIISMIDGGTSIEDILKQVKSF